MNKFNTLKKMTFFVLSSAIVLGGCEKEPFNDLKKDIIPEDKNIQKVEIPWIKGEAYVKFTENNKTKSSNISSALNSLAPLTKGGSNNFKMEPIFDISGEYADAMKREGLDRWYKITFDKNIDVQSVINELEGDKSIEIVHGGLPIEQTKVNYTPYTQSTLTKVSGYPDLNDGYKDFNNIDPLLKHQWHYCTENNSVQGYEVGADINLFKAWDITTGDEKVVVAIIDSGIDFTHPDLQDAKWKDEKGNSGGKNFVDTTRNDIDPGYHGTHVAGTVAARNNNGIGVSGVAGGGVRNEKGATLMSCQIFGADKADGTTAGTAKADQIANAFVWAAQNGAVIANCSWGYSWDKNKYVTPEYYKEVYKKSSELIKVGIDFFIKYAGNDPNTLTKKSNSLMSGGVVFFASGNDSAVDVDIAPSSNPEVISVCAFKSDFSIADYANKGTWVNILAPGGDVSVKNYNSVKNGILSTVPSHFATMSLYKDGPKGSEYLVEGFDNQYAYAQGTSMATPHVSGIAALMVSHFGKKMDNFTNKELKRRILAAVKSKDFEAEYPYFKGKLGVGFIDALFALKDPETQAPDKVVLTSSDLNYYDAKIKWKVTSDNDAITTIKSAYAYDIYLSDKEISKMPDTTIVAYSFDKAVGEEMEHQFTKLESNKTYYVAVVARDRYGNKSAISSTKFTTKLNYVPEFVNRPKEMFIIPNTQPYFTYSYKVVDKENHTWDFKTSELPSGVTLVREGSNLVLTVLVKDKVGTYSFDVVLKDKLNGEKVERIEYKIVNYSAPKLVADLADIAMFKDDNPVILELKEMYEATSSDATLKFSAKSNNPEVVDIMTNGTTLTIIPNKKGTATITITVDDGKKKSQNSFQVNVTEKNNSDVYALYPIPAHSYLKMLVHPDINKVNVKVTSVRGELLIHKNLSVDKKTNEVTLDVDKLVPGIYNLIVKSDRATTKRTFIKN